MVLCSIIDVFKKIADKCVDPIVGYVTTEVGYLSNYEANIENLRAEVQNLNDATHDLKAEIEDAQNRSGATQVAAVAQRWLERMTDLNKEASRIIRDEERETERCLMGLRFNLWACYLASKSARKVMDAAEKLKEDGANIDKVAHIDYSQCLGVETNLNFAELESRKKVSDQIVEHLKDPDVKIVGMYGMGGAGKTTLAEKIGKQLYEDGTFKYVVLSVVSNEQKQDPIYSIQKQIADLLKIELKEKDGPKARAKQLREQLEKKDKVLVILDDIWHRLELADVGIPVDRELTILITSRNLDVMNDMDSEHNVQLDILSDDDAWKLFDKMAGGVAPHSDLYSTARAVVEKCGGIPVLLVTIARALRKRDLKTWKEALTQLERFEGVEGDNFVEDAYKRIEVSYHFLKNDEIRSLFLLCSQLDHRSILIDDLLRYTMGLGLFQRRKKLKEVSQRLHLHLGHLKGYCLLQDGSTEGTVRMHDVVYKFAAFVAFRDHHMFTVADGQLEEWPPKDELEQFSAITLPYGHLPNHQLPKAFDSSKLESFLLFKSRGDAPLNIPDEFFIGMKELKLVDLTRVSLSPALPSSLNFLVKLRTLCLDNCELDDITIIGELPMLQVLSLMGSTLSHLPKEIGRLGSSLKLLDLRRCRNLKVIAAGVFSNLTLLEDLRIGDSFDNWEQLQGCSSSTDHETTSTTTKKLASLMEFKNLGNLINLEIHIPNPKMTFPKELVFSKEKLERFTITFGQKVYGFSKDSTSGTLEVNHVEDIQLYEGIKTLMGKANRVHLEAVEGVTSVCELAPKGFPELKDLTIVEAVEIQFIVKRGYNNCAVFPKLEYLKLKRMRKLERIICDDHDCLFPVGSLRNLTTIELERCDVLKYLFLSRHLPSHLLCLKEIRLEECESMQFIIADDGRCQLDKKEGDEITHEFTQLRALSLNYLLGLISFYSNTPNPIISSSQERQEKDPMLSSGDEIVEDNMLSSGDEVVEDYMLSSGDEIVEDNMLSSGDEVVEDPMLSSGDEIVENNQRLLTSLFNKKVVLPKLEWLELSWIEVDEIWDNQLAIEAERTNCWFQHLTILRVAGCDNLSYLFTSSMVKSLAQLKTLDVYSCNSIEEIVVATKGEMTEDDVMLSFPALDTLQLITLPKFKRLCHANLLECQSLQKLVIKKCGSSPASLDANSSSILFHKNVVLPKLKDLEFSTSDNQLPIAAERTNWFQNLTILKVTSCHNLNYLFTFSMAKSLAQLEYLSIDYCDSLKEIVSKEEASNNSTGDIIVFGKLKTLYLSSLRSLISFCSTTNCNFQFSSLDRVTVVECPSMEFFSEGTLRTPNLSMVTYDGVAGRWEGDLNSTMRQLYKEMNSTYDEHFEAE